LATPGVPEPDLLLLAVAVAGALGGLGPAAVATRVGLMEEICFRTEPVRMFLVARQRDRVELTVFLASAIAIAVSLEDPGAPDVMASRGQLEQVLVNLVTYAARATRPGEKGTIVVRIGTGSPGTVFLEVEDRGIWIDPANVGRVFDPFFTTHPRTVTNR
jgi:signal transduction histidine kinase